VAAPNTMAVSMALLSAQVFLAAGAASTMHGGVGHPPGSTLATAKVQLGKPVHNFAGIVGRGIVAHIRSAT